MVGVEVGDPERASHFVTTTSIFSSFVYFVDNSSLVVSGILEEGSQKKRPQESIHEIHEPHEKRRQKRSGAVAKIVYNLRRSK